MHIARAPQCSAQRVRAGPRVDEFRYHPPGGLMGTREAQITLKTEDRFGAEARARRSHVLGRPIKRRSGRVSSHTPDRHLPQRAGEPGEQGLARRDQLTLARERERESAEPCHADDEGNCESRLYPDPINKQRESSA